jgi:hypothetical protein
MNRTTEAKGLGPDLAWLAQHGPLEWLGLAKSELSIAEQAFAADNDKRGLAACRRAGGMAINAVLTLTPSAVAAFGRSYMDHLAHLAKDQTAPLAVQGAAALLLRDPRAGSTGLAVLRTNAREPALEAAKDIVAHAYALVLRMRTS